FVVRKAKSSGLMGSSATEDFPAMQEIFMEFRAGRMIMEGKRVVPDPHKGLVRMGRDQIVFPEEAVFEKVTQASGRVYILKFNTDDRKFFFWMQEPNPEGDSQLCDLVNFYINRPLEFLGEEEPDASVPLQSSEDIADEDISSRAGNLVGSSMGTEVTSDVTSSGPVKLVDLQRILSNIGPAGEVEDPDAGETRREVTLSRLRGSRAFKAVGRLLEASRVQLKLCGDKTESDDGRRWLGVANMRSKQSKQLLHSTDRLPKGKHRSGKVAGDKRESDEGLRRQARVLRVSPETDEGRRGVQKADRFRRRLIQGRSSENTGLARLLETGEGLASVARDKGRRELPEADRYIDMTRLTKSFGLGDILKPDWIFPLLENIPLEERLVSYLPEGQWTSEELIDLLQSPPFRQQVDSFTYVLRTGQIDLTQFGIDPSKYKFTVLSFLEALEDSLPKMSEPEDSTQGEKDLIAETSNRGDPMDEGR
ncbi:hypothetical protein C3L33_12146, partial [Rhododendron williamsianum]